MPTAIIMPKFEMAQETGTVARWLKQNGDQVTKGDPVLEVETDKVTMEVEAPASGVLTGISAEPGQVVPIGQDIAYILKPGEALPGSPGKAAVAAPPQPAEPAPPASAASTVTRATPLAERVAEAHRIDLRAVAGTGPQGRVMRSDVESLLARRTLEAADTELTEGKLRAVPAARRLARELGIDLATVIGTGPEGRIQSDDVRQAAAAQAAAVATPVAPVARLTPTEQPVATGAVLGQPAARRTVPLTNIRRTIAERMTASVREAPQFTVSVDADMSRALAIVEDLRVGAGDGRGTPKITLTTLLVKACAWALVECPAANSSFNGDHIVEWDEVNIGVATAAEQGLLVPVIRNVDRLGIRDIAARLADVTSRAREGRLRLEDIQGGTFTLSNLGMLGIDRFTAILNPPQAAILASGRVVKQPVVLDDDRIIVKPMASLTLTADHRALDGAGAARFLGTIQRALEHPGLLLS